MLALAPMLLLLLLLLRRMKVRALLALLLLLRRRRIQIFRLIVPQDPMLLLLLRLLSLLILLLLLLGRQLAHTPMLSIHLKWIPRMTRRRKAHLRRWHVHPARVLHFRKLLHSSPPTTGCALVVRGGRK